MPAFDYRAAKPDGELVHGRMEARSQDELVQRLQADGKIFISATSGEQLQARASKLGDWRASRFDAELFTFELAALLQSGLTLPRALELLADLSESKATAQAVGSLNESVRGGTSFAAALEALEHPLPPFYIGLVKAGEAAGHLDKTLQELATHLQRSRVLRDTLVSALIYPVILLCVALCTLVLMLTVVVPRFAALFADAGEKLPLPTQAVLLMGDFLLHKGWVIVLVIAGGALLVRYMLRFKEKRLLIHKAILSIPLAGSLASRLATARFARTLSTLINSGVPLAGALPYCTDVVSNEAVSQAVTELAREVRAGESLAGAMARADVFPELAHNLVKVGEETGALQSMLEHVATLYESEVERSLKRAVTLVEPAIIVIIGGLVGGMIYSIISAVLAVNEIVL